MKISLISFCMLLFLHACGQSTSQPKTMISNVGGPCEGCEAIHESSVPFAELKWIDTLPGFAAGDPKMHVTGTVYKSDGKTPAPDVVLYIYHTDKSGIYPTKGDESGWGKRHGYLRGWIKTNEQG
jgi:protocatechuate 3,4-dioxygenase, beta subunit